MPAMTFLGMPSLRTGRRKSRAALLAWILSGAAACVAPADPPAGETEGDGSSSSSTTTAQTSASTSTSVAGSSSSTSTSTTGPDATTLGSTATTVGSESSTGDACADAEPVENPETFNCVTSDPSTCPDCHKCARLVDETNSFVGTVCVPVDADPQGLGEPCSLGDQPGYDDCDDDLLCWNPNDEGRNGTCVPHCMDGKSCQDGYDCLSSAKGPIACLPTCDPLSPQCADGEDCLPVGNDAYVCYPAIRLPGAGEACTSICAEGLTCIGAQLLPECDGEACCTSLCEPGGDQCDAEGETCLPDCLISFIPSEELSACGVAPDPLPADCPPAGIDPNIPWCSDGNNDACPEPDLGFGYGDDCVEECSCGITCDDVSECPTPATGTATRQCASIDGGQEDICLLSCAGGEVCPDGMYCSSGYPGLCVWFNELEPGCLD